MTLDVTPKVPQGRLTVQAYGDGGFRLNGERVLGSRILFSDRHVGWAAIQWEDITAESLAPVAEAGEVIEILLIGCGLTFQPIPAGLREAVKAMGAVLEWMDTGAACRTFNVLVGEERRVAAAVLAVD